jgi:microcystin degradation protein MlrC
MVRAAPLLHGYKTYPHGDMAERGGEAAARLVEVVQGRIRPTVAFRQPALLPPLGSQGTARGPLRRLGDQAAEMEQEPGVLSISIFAGFPLADIRDAGLAIYVATDGDGALAEKLADRLAATAWEHRREFVHVVKSTIHYRAAFEPVAHAILEVDAPGLSSSNLGRFDFKHVRRPIFPLDDL